MNKHVVCDFNIAQYIECQHVLVMHHAFNTHISFRYHGKDFQLGTYLDPGLGEYRGTENNKLYFVNMMPARDRNASAGSDPHSPFLRAFIFINSCSSWKSILCRVVDEEKRERDSRRILNSFFCSTHLAHLYMQSSIFLYKYL